MSDICVNITDLMEEYILHRDYDTHYGDAIPLIMANAFKKDILIIEYASTEIDRVRHVSPIFVPSRKLSTLVLFNCDEHYESCLFSGTAPHNMLNNVDVDVFDSSLCKNVSNAGNVCSDDPKTGVIVGNYKPESLIPSDDNIGEVNGVHDSTSNMFPEIKLFRKTHKQNFIFVHVNINSYRHTFSHLQEILRGRFVDLLITSESKLDGSFPNSQFNVEGCTIDRQDKSASRGGLILYIRADIAHRRMPKFECNCFGMESICLEINNGVSKSLISSIYKHPQLSDPTFLSHISGMADKQFLYNDDLTFVGDMNCCPRKSDVIKRFFVIFMIFIWLYLQLAIKVTTQLCWMLYLYLNLVVLPSHLIVNVF